MPQRQREETIAIGEGGRAQKVRVHITEPAPGSETDQAAGREDAMPLELASPRNARGQRAYAEYVKGWKDARGR